MSLLVSLILGGIIGYIAGRVGGRDEGVIVSVIIGVIGSIIGGLLSTMLSGSDQSFLAFSWVGLAWSFVGSLILVFILNAVQRRSRHSSI